MNLKVGEPGKKELVALQQEAVAAAPAGGKGVVLQGMTYAVISAWAHTRAWHCMPGQPVYSSTCP